MALLALVLAARWELGEGKGAVPGVGRRERAGSRDVA